MRDQTTGRALPDVEIRLRQDIKDLAGGKTNDLGCAGLTFRAPDASPTSLGGFPGVWVVATLTKGGYETLELPLVIGDFVETRDLRLLTRGVTLQRAS